MAPPLAAELADSQVLRTLTTRCQPSQALATQLLGSGWTDNHLFRALVAIGLVEKVALHTAPSNT